jgi:plasmid replication initiation protein
MAKKQVDKAPADKVKTTKLSRTRKAALPEKLTMIKQPNRVTMMRYDFTTYQSRIFYAIIFHLQIHIEAVIKGADVEQLPLFKEADKDKIRLVIPIKEFGVQAKDYEQLKNAMLDVATIPVQLDTTDPVTGAQAWVIQGLFRAYIPQEKYQRNVTIEIDKLVAQNLINSRIGGFTKFAYEIAISATNKFTPRIYVFISSWKDQGGVTISLDKFRQMLALENKYPNFRNLMARVIEPARMELHEKADVWFELDTILKGKKVDKLVFKIIKASEIRQLHIQRENMKNQILYWCVDRFNFKESNKKQLLSLITNDNIQAIYYKIVELNEYIIVQNRAKEIRSLPEYILRAITKMLADRETQGVEPEDATIIQ